jgi:hypothetical protein
MVAQNVKLCKSFHSALMNAHKEEMAGAAHGEAAE